MSAPHHVRSATGKGTTTSPVRHGLRKFIARNHAAYLFLLPAALILVLVNFAPMAQAVVTSAHSFSIFRPGERTFVGFQNYIALFSDSLFWRSLGQTAVYTLGSVVTQFILGLAAAMILNRKMQGRAMFRAIALIPWVIPGSLAAVMFALLFTSTGMVNILLDAIGIVDAGLIPPDYPWLSNPASAMLVLILTNAWKGFPFFAVMLLAAMQAVPSELYEAARVDGARPWRQFTHITLPGIRMTLLVSLLLQTIWTFNALDAIYVMTSGGPAHATTTLVMHAYLTAFGLGQVGHASAIAVAALVVIAAVAWVYLLLYRRIGDDA